jgi:flagellar biosynthesis protein FlhG
MTIPDQDHYELLELPRDATYEDVQRAYRLARSTWEEGGLAVYSVASESELSAVRERVEAAYRVLSDMDARGAYDVALGQLLPAHCAEPDLGLDDDPEQPEHVELPAEIESFEDLSGPENGRWTGAALRRTRLARGLELEQISAITKVNPLYLGCIEAERFDALPASVYVRGFVSAYARCLGLDAGRVASDYVERLQLGRPDRAPRRRRP